MNVSMNTLSRIAMTALILGLAMNTCLGICYAESSKENNNPAMLPPPTQEDQSILKRRLQIAKRDLDAFRIFAENIRKNGDMKVLAQLQTPVDEFLKKHVDNLLAQGAERSNLDTTRLTAEIIFLKARLLMSLNREDAARGLVADMKKRFGPYQKISVELPGKTTTMDEGIRLLDEELAKSATIKK